MTSAIAIDPPPDTLTAYEPWAAALRLRQDVTAVELRRLRGEFPSSTILDRIAALERERSTIVAVLEFSDKHTLPQLRAAAVAANLSQTASEVQAAVDARLAAYSDWVRADAEWKIATAALELGCGDGLERDRRFQAVGHTLTLARAAEAHHEALLDRIRALERDFAAVATPPATVAADLDDAGLAAAFERAGILLVGDAPATASVIVWREVRFTISGDATAFPLIRAYAGRSPAHDDRCVELLRSRPQAVWQVDSSGTWRVSRYAPFAAPAAAPIARDVLDAPAPPQPPAEPSAVLVGRRGRRVRTASA